MNRNAPLRIVLIGCVVSSEIALRTLLSLKTVCVVGLVTRRGSSFNSDFVDLAPLAKERNIPILFAEDAANDSEQVNWLRKCKPDVIFTIGWSRLLPREILDIPQQGAIGFHPAALPANRGRHPIIWALALGLSETASSFFLMGAGADDGPIVSQSPVSISATDTAQTLYDKILALIPQQIEKIVTGLIDGKLIALPQEDRLTNYWRKRGEDDGRIDWRMSARSIYNLVRALSKPYPGAHFTHDGRSVKVWCCIVEPNAPLNIEPGKVLSVEGSDIIIKTGEQAVRLLDHEMAVMPSKGDYL